MASELISGLGLFKTMLDVAKGMKNMNDAVVRNAAVIELQEHILTAQEQQIALVQEIRELKERVAEMEKWDADKERYKLKEFASGQFAYLLKEEVGSSEPAHMLCANCYNQNQKSILQTEVRNPGRHTVHFCQRCGGDIFDAHTGGRG